jgi:hypothetical protein
MEEVSFGLTGIVWNEEGRFWPDLNGLRWRKSVLARLKWLGMKEFSFGLTEKAWNGGSQFWPDWNSLEWRKSVLVDWNGGSQF